MDSRERVRKMFEQAKQALGMEDSVRLVLYPMKYKVASVSIKTATLRLNKNLVGLLTDDELHYILVHELVHLKLKSLNHGEEFYKLLHTLYQPEKSEEVESKIIKKLIDANMKAKNGCSY